jgi:hypothetical protein
MLERVVSAAVAILLATGGVGAGKRDATAFGAAEAIEMLAAIGDWLATERGLPEVSELPRIEFDSPERLLAMRLGGAPSAGGGPTPDLTALYHDAERTIRLPQGWTGATPAEVSILVHEMVHHVQNVAGLRYDCPEARERPAFAAQEAWLAQSGGDLASVFGIDPLTLLVRTRCFH